MSIVTGTGLIRRLEVFGKHISRTGGVSVRTPLIKQITDFTLALLLLVISSPVVITACLISFFETRRFPIFTQFRGVSLNGKTFRIYKIRTLRVTDAPINNSKNLSKPELQETVTRSGAWMRRTGIDELPQLVNVLMGDMSLVGPRPLSIEDLEMINETRPDVNFRRGQLRSKPGLTGYWQIFGERNKGIENLIELDCHYEENRSFSFDAFLIAITVPVALFARHSDAILGEKKK